MTQQPTPDELRLARRIVEKYWIDEEIALPAMILLPVIEAIRETSELAADMTEKITIKLPGIGTGLADGASVARGQIIDALRNGDHLKGPAADRPTAIARNDDDFGCEYCRNDGRLVQGRCPKCDAEYPEEHEG